MSIKWFQIFVVLTTIKQKTTFFHAYIWLYVHIAKTSYPVGDKDYVCLSFLAASLCSIYKLIIAKYLQNIKGKEKIMCLYHPIGLL